MAKSNFHNVSQPRHQKVRRIPIKLLDKIKKELTKFLDKNNIIKLPSCPRFKRALDSKILNKAIHTKKYQMPNIDTLIESIFQQISAPAPQNTTYFSTLDLKYA